MSDGGDLSLMDLFREEARAHAAALGQGLLELEKEPSSPQRIEPLMRAAHSIKGAARIVNLDPAVRLAHAMEDALVAAQEGRLRIGPAETDLLLRGTDLLAGLAQVREAELPAWTASRQGEVADLQGRLRALLRGEPPAAVPPADNEPSPPPKEAIVPAEPTDDDDEDPMLGLFREEVGTHALTLSRGVLELASRADAGRIEPLLHAANAIRGAARIVQVEPAARLAQVLADVLAAARDGALNVGQEHLDLLRRGAELLAGLTHVSRHGLAGWAAAHEAEVGGLKQRLEAAPRGRPPAPAPPAPAPAAAPAAPPPAEAPPAEEAVVRVTARSLTRLMGLAGESLVQARWLDPFAAALRRLNKQQDRLAGLLDGLGQALAAGTTDRALDQVTEARQQASRCRQVLAERLGEFEDHAAHAEDLNGRLYHEVLASRMRPFADGAHGFPRLVRDTARRLGKQVRLEILGQNTEVDRDILEKLEAPLTHLLRNAVDHGVEPPAERLAAGKPEAGLVRLEVHHRAGMLAVTVSDDGAGIDPERLRRKVVERGLTTPDMARSLREAELLEFLFLPGFSTAASLTEFSGRGVGLDVVQDAVRKVGGTVRVTTRAGQGTRFHLLLPVTLSVLRAVLVDIGGEPYAFPHNRIDRLLRVPRAEVCSLENRQFIIIDGQNVGLVLAAQVLDLEAAPPAAEELPVLLLGDATGHYGLIVEAFRGEQDLVVRPLDPRLGKVPNVSAAAVLDDGSPVLIADVEDLIRSTDRFIQGGSLRRAEREKAGGGPRKRVLVVDDSITVREVERQLLRNQGYDVTVAVDGQEGWNLARAGRFDLVVTDVDMPRLNGLDLVRALRADAALHDLPVVVVSYKEREEDRLRGLDAGANAYLTKSSFHDNTFLRAVADLIGEA